MKRLILNSLFVCAAFLTVSAKANLLVDPGFEANPLDTITNVISNFPLYQGVWGTDTGSSITGIDGGVAPAQGNKQLRIVVGGATEGLQLTDVTSYAALIDSGGATATLSAQFNANFTGAMGGLFVTNCTAGNLGSQIGTNGNYFALDGVGTTWESFSISYSIPIGTRWLLSQAPFISSTLVTSDGVDHPSYIDAANLTITPEPATMCLLGLGGLLFARKKK